MNEGSRNGHHDGGEDAAASHRSEHYYNLLGETLTLLLEDSHDEDEVDDIVDSVILELVDAIAGGGFRLPRALMEAVSAWVGTDDPRAYLRATYVDEHGRLRHETPEPIVRYLTQSDEQYWPED
ncbi:MAG: hypothetical protein U0821_08225 [Chloroflexota bacterium]